MGAPSLLGVALAGRTIPVVASIVLHAGLAAGLLANGGLHGVRGDKPSAMQELSIDVETAPAQEEEKREETPAPAITPPATSLHRQATHTHDHPVPPSHDAHPHDPATQHPTADPAPPSTETDAPATAASAPPVAAPRFVLSNASSTGTGTIAARTLGGATHATGAGGDDDNAIVSASAVDVAAKLVRSAPLAYPPEARADDREADVTLEIVVDREGLVVDARVTRPASSSFDAAAIAAVRRYRFSPAQRKGHAVRVRMPWAVQFRLR